MRNAFPSFAQILVVELNFLEANFVSTCVLWKKQQQKPFQ